MKPHKSGWDVNPNPGRMLWYGKHRTAPFRSADGGYLLFADEALTHEKFADLTPSFFLLVCGFF